ncbi:MAG: polysaccharide biosynthesis tyrosine autokinase [Sodaliphilus sp.]
MDNKPSLHTETPSESTSSIKLIPTILRYWWLFLLSFVICFGLLFLYLRITPSSYLIVSTIMVEDDPFISFVGGGSSKSNSMLKSVMGGDANVYNEIEILGSESMVAKTIGELGINCRYYEKTGFMKKKDHYGTSPIVVEAPKEVFDTLSVSLPFKIKVHANGTADITVKKSFFKNYAKLEGVQLPATVKTPYGLFVVKPTKYFTPNHEYTITASVAGIIPAALSLQEDMTVDQKAKKTDLIYVDVVDSDVKRGRDFLTTLVRLYNERGLEDKDKQGMVTAKFIDDRLSLIYKNLMGSEAEIEAYKKAHNMVDPFLKAKTAIAKEESSEAALVALETQYRISGMIKSFITDPSNRLSLIPFETDSTSASMVRAYNALITQRQHLAHSAKADNPALVQLDQQLNAMRENMIGSVNNALGALKIKIEQAKSVLGEGQSGVNDFASAERDTRNLYRDQAIQNELYLFLLQKREENALKMAAAQPKGKTVDAAFAGEKPVKPKKAIALLIALIFAIALPVVWIYTKLLLDNKVRNRLGLKELSKAPILGGVSHNKDFSYIYPEEGNSYDEFRVIRDNLQFMLPNQDCNVVALTSASAAEGKTYLAINLASAFAKLGKKVALVELNFREPCLAKVLNLPTNNALTSFVSQSNITISEIVQTYNSEPLLDIYPAGTVPPNPSELLQNERTAQLFKQLRSQYDVVIVDTVGACIVSDTLSVAKYSDTTVVVVRANSTKNSNIYALNQLLEEGKLKNMGFVLNDEPLS